ncbi:MAG: ATP-binding protein, partial [Bacteroidales bacterium]|nr:ATP-binding protein [Bacteroidales bacterium]
MKITIDNLGVVRHIEFDTQKPLSLFCGPNGTGKTYVAYVLDAIANNEVSFAYTTLTTFNNLTKTISLSDILVVFKKAIEDILKRNLGNIFGVSDDFVLERFNNTIVDLSFSDSDIEIISKDLKNYFTIVKQNDVLIVEKVSPSKILFALSRCVKLLFNVRIFTVERNSIYTFERELSINRNDLVDKLMALKDKNNVNLSEVLMNNSRRYPMAVRNGLKVASDLLNVIKFRGDFYDVASDLEKLLRGRIEISQYGGVEFIVGDNIALPIQLSSSIVKTMSSLVLYLKYIVKKGDTLIIDEPEMNLHPDNQILLARIFAQMVNMGIKLVISTHSDYIIREFNNLIMLSGV